MSTCTRYTQQLVRRHFTLDAAFPTTLELFREASTAALKSEVSFNPTVEIHVVVVVVVVIVVVVVVFVLS